MRAQEEVAGDAGDEDVRGPPGQERMQQTGAPDGDERADQNPVGERDHDAEADAVEGAAPSGADAEGDREQRHHQRHERKRHLALEIDGGGRDVEAARAHLVDVAAQLADGHELGVRGLFGEVLRARCR